MAISRRNATAAVNSLKGLEGATLFDMMRVNQHLYEKHLGKDTAQAAARRAERPQGYFEQEKTIVFNSLEEFQDEGKVSQRRQDRWLEKRGWSRLKPHQLRKRVRGEMKVTDDLVPGTLANLISFALKQDVYGLYESVAHPDSRFLFVTDIPDGFVGRSVDGGGNKATVGLVVIVINAPAGANAQVVTAYPVDAAFVQGQTPLADDLNT
jgi:hypothetical protein